MRSLSLVCRCGHRRDVHQHHRPGRDCGVCGRVGCESYRPTLQLRGRGQAPPPPAGGDPAPAQVDAPAVDAPAVDAPAVDAPAVPVRTVGGLQRASGDDRPLVRRPGPGRRHLSLA